jgi:hypothetical protein
MWYAAGMAKPFAARRWIYVRGSYKKVAVLAVVVTTVQPGELNEMSPTARL